MQVERHEPIIIELDDPTPHWYRWGIPLGALLAVAMFIAPWFLETDPQEDAPVVQTQQAQSAGRASVCQPTVDIPAFAQPAASMVIPSWMRICDWFAEPVGQPSSLPAEPEQPPRFAD